MKTLLVLIAALSITQQQDDVMKAVRAAMNPALQSFPLTEADGAVPVGGNTEALWMVRPLEAGDTAIEIHENPLNQVNQAKAAKAMAAIERNIEAAQRRADAQYDRAVEEARRTGKSQEVDGVTLSDEGIEGAKIDAESQVIVDIAFNQPAYRYAIVGAAPPVTSSELNGAVSIVAFPSNTYKDSIDKSDRFFAAETLVFLGRVAAPQVSKRGDNSYEVSVTATPADHAGVNTIVLRFKGNEALVKDLLNKTAWSQLLELTK